MVMPTIGTDNRDVGSGGGYVCKIGKKGFSESYVSGHQCNLLLRWDKRKIQWFIVGECCHPDHECFRPNACIRVESGND